MMSGSAHLKRARHRLLEDDLTAAPVVRHPSPAATAAPPRPSRGELLARVSTSAGGAHELRTSSAVGREGVGAAASKAAASALGAPHLRAALDSPAATAARPRTPAGGRGGAATVAHAGDGAGETHATPAMAERASEGGRALARQVVDNYTALLVETRAEKRLRRAPLLGGARADALADAHAAADAPTPRARHSASVADAAAASAAAASSAYGTPSARAAPPKPAPSPAAACCESGSTGCAEFAAATPRGEAASGGLRAGRSTRDAPSSAAVPPPLAAPCGCVKGCSKCSEEHARRARDKRDARAQPRTQPQPHARAQPQQQAQQPIDEADDGTEEMAPMDVDADAADADAAPEPLATAAARARAAPSPLDPRRASLMLANRTAHAPAAQPTQAGGSARSPNRNAPSALPAAASQPLARARGPAAAAEPPAPAAAVGCTRCASARVRCSRCVVKAQLLAERTAKRANADRAARSAELATTNSCAAAAAAADADAGNDAGNGDDDGDDGEAQPAAPRALPSLKLVQLAPNAPHPPPPSAAAPPPPPRRRAPTAAAAVAAPQRAAVPSAPPPCALGAADAARALRAALNTRVLSHCGAAPPAAALGLGAAEFGGVASTAECEAELARLVGLTLTHGENTSALLVGPRGSGKARLVRRVLGAHRAASDAHAGFQLVELSGCLQKDDGASLLEIARQLSVENQLDEHVAGLAGRGGGGGLSLPAGLRLILTQLRAASLAQQAVVFVLHAFENWAARAKQSLLYSLLDLAQSAHARVCILGLGSRLDALDCLEKRVRSRFSGRVLLLASLADADDVRYVLGGLLSLGGGRAGALDEGAVAAEIAASAPDGGAFEALRADARGADGGGAAANAAVCAGEARAAALARHPPFAAAATALAAQWHATLGAALSDERVCAWAARVARVGCTRKQLVAKACVIVSHLGGHGGNELRFGQQQPQQQPARANRLPTAAELESLVLASDEGLATPSAAELLSDLSLLDLLLVVSLHRLAAADKPPPHSFATAMLEYDSFVRSSSAAAQFQHGRPALLKAYEDLVQLGLVHLRGGRARAQLQHAPMRLAVCGDELRAFVRAKRDCPLLVQRWATSFIDAVVS